MHRNGFCATAALAAVLAAGSASSARAGFQVTFTGSGTNPASNHALAASAIFELTSSTNLRVTLTNTSTQTYGVTHGKAVPTDVLTALFFDTTPWVLPVNALVSATASAVVSGTGSTFKVVNGPIAVEVPGMVGGWAFNSAPPNQGLGTVGLGVFQGVGGNAQLNFGIINSLYEGDGNGGVTSRTLVRDQVTFDLTVGSGFDLGSIHNVRFQYGTSLSEPSLTGNPQPPAVPAPPSLVLAVTGCVPVGLAFLRRRFR